jgi:hypothetical protein
MLRAEHEVPLPDVGHMRIIAFQSAADRLLPYSDLGPPLNPEARASESFVGQAVPYAFDGG